MIDDLYEIMASRGLTHSRRHFSTELLGAAHNYATANRGCRPSDTVMIHLIRWLHRRRRYVLALLCLQMLLWPDRPHQRLWCWR